MSNCALKNSQSLVLGFLYLSRIQMAVKAYQVRFCVCVNFFFFPHWKMQFVKKVNFLLPSPLRTEVVYIELNIFSSG